MTETLSIETTLQQILSQIPLVERTDFSILVKIIDSLENISKHDSAPDALKTQSDRTAYLGTCIIMGDTPFDIGIQKLTTSIERMIESVEKQSSNIKNENTNEIPEKEQLRQVAEDLKDLTVKFANNQKITLEDLETYTFELEKGTPEAKDAIKRYLHTLKGEYGVLDLGIYADLIHKVEEKIDIDQISTDNLFELKDFISRSLASLLNGLIIPITPTDYKKILNEENCESTENETPDLSNNNSSLLDKTAENDSIENKPSEEFIISDPSLVADFISESTEHIATSESELLELEHSPDNDETLNTIFRSCHTIKGVAGFLNFTTISTLSHKIENLMDKARKKEIALTSNHIDLLFESFDCLKSMVLAVENALNGDEYTFPENYSKILSQLEENDTKNESVVIQEEFLDAPKIGEILTSSGEVSKKDVEIAVEKQKEGDTRKVGEILVEEKKVTENKLKKALTTQKNIQKGTVEETIRVPISRLDQLIDVIGEAVIAHSMLVADEVLTSNHNPQLDRKIAQSEIIMRNVQELSMALRMVSIRSTFQKMARLVRDLSKKNNKSIEFVMEGEDTEIDKSIVEKISDPLIHMVRNAVDHGIEDSEEERINSGKNGKATVTLRAFHKAGNVFIEIEDDGRGLDKDAILQKAEERGLCGADETPSENEIFQYIFEPGFSTAKKITDISGRGVGMDVVKKNIQLLRGAVDIKSTLGKGTVFSIRLPLTLAVISGMIVKVADERYIVPTLSVIESLCPQKEQVQKVVGKGEILNVRGQLMPFVRLSSIFNIEAGFKTKPSDGIALIVEDLSGKKTALFVDSIIDQQQVVIKNLGETFGSIQGVSGGAIMSDGDISLIIDISGIIRLYNKGGQL